MTGGVVDTFTYHLTSERRREACVHEAAHAIIASLGDTFTFCLAVAPVGAVDWSYTNRKGGTLIDLWGVHEHSDAPFPWRMVRWDEAEGCYDAHQAREALKAAMRTLKPRDRKAYYRSLRAYLCQSLAGNLAESLYRNEEPDLEGECGTRDDIAQAVATTWLLPYRREFDHAVSVTRAALRDNWPMVIVLADALEAKGCLEDDLPGYLPPPRRDWPPPPAKAKAAARSSE